MGVRVTSLVAVSLLVAACSSGQPSDPSDSGTPAPVDATVDNLQPPCNPSATCPTDGNVPPSEADVHAEADVLGDHNAIDVPDTLVDSPTNDRDNEAGLCFAPHEPTLHRPQSMACPSARGVGDPSTPQPSDECMNDAECTAGTNGRCLYPVGGPGHKICNYDDCTTDSDCQGNAVCYCRPGTTSNLPNICLYGGNCRTDADCAGSGSYRSLSKIPGNFSTRDGGVLVSSAFANGYFCHTNDDCCTDDAECAPNGIHFNYCLYATTSRHWTCGGGP